MTDLNKTADDVIKDEQEAVGAYTRAQPARSSIEQATKPALGGEPALILGTLVGVIIAILAVTGVVDVSTADGFVTSLAPVLGGLITRHFVSPAVVE